MSIDQTYQINKYTSVSIPPAALCRTYGTIITYTETLQVHFETEVSMLGTFEDKGFLYMVNKKQVYINNKEPQLLVDKLADDMGKVLYPVLLVADYYGQIQTIINYEDILNRWTSIKKQVLRYYQGKIVQDAVAQMEASLQHIVQVTEALKKDWFIAIFFSGINGNKGLSFKRNTHFLLPVIPYAPMVKYDAAVDLTERDTEAQTFRIEYKGRVKEERSAEDIENKSPVPMQEFLFGHSTKAAGDLNINYNMYLKDYSIRSVNAKIKLTLPAGREKKIVLGIYHLEDKDKLLKEAVKFEEPKKKKRKFF